MAPINPSDAGPRRIGRLLGTSDILIGAITFARAGDIARRPWWRISTRGMSRVVRVLAARQVVQGLVTVAVPNPGVLAAGGTVDLLHALSMVPVALTRGPYRGPAARSALLAGTAAVTGYAGALAGGR